MREDNWLFYFLYLAAVLLSAPVVSLTYTFGILFNKVKIQK